MSADRIVLGSFALVIGAGAYAIYTSGAQNAPEEASARAAGFANQSEQTNAAALGAKTPAEWKARLAEDAEKKTRLPTSNALRPRPNVSANGRPTRQSAPPRPRPPANKGWPNWKSATKFGGAAAQSAG
jgi:hypothetical protein